MFQKLIGGGCSHVCAQVKNPTPAMVIWDTHTSAHDATRKLELGAITWWCTIPVFPGLLADFNKARKYSIRLRKFPTVIRRVCLSKLQALKSEPPCPCNGEILLRRHQLLPISRTFRASVGDSRPAVLSTIGPSERSPHSKYTSTSRPQRILNLRNWHRGGQGRQLREGMRCCRMWRCGGIG